MLFWIPAETLHPLEIGRDWQSEVKQKAFQLEKKYLWSVHRKFTIDVTLVRKYWAKKENITKMANAVHCHMLIHSLIQSI